MIEIVINKHRVFIIYIILILKLTIPFSRNHAINKRKIIVLLQFFITMVEDFISMEYNYNS